MSDQSLAVIPSGTVAGVQTSPDPVEIEVSADTPSEMKSAQARLIAWCELKIARLKGDLAELIEAYDHAKSKKWKTATFASHRDKTRRRVEYYEKMLAAFRAGYMLVPNFPLGVFAVRTDREYPKRVYTSWSHSSEHDQKPSLSPVGEGEYQNPKPTVYIETRTVSDGKGGTKQEDRYFTADEFGDIDFPINMAKPHIMEITSHAMGLKIFDEIGVLPSPHRKVDPVICGTIKLKEGYSTRVATFMLAWHIDTRTL